MKSIKMPQIDFCDFLKFEKFNFCNFKKNKQKRKLSIFEMFENNLVFVCFLYVLGLFKMFYDHLNMLNISEHFF